MSYLIILNSLDLGVWLQYDFFDLLTLVPELKEKLSMILPDGFDFGLQPLPLSKLSIN